MPVDNNEHQRIDDVNTDRISYDCCVQVSQ